MKQFLLAFLFLLATATSGFSTIIGGSITFACDSVGGTDSILVRLTLYRDCTGINFGNTQSLDVIGGGPGCSPNSFDVHQVAGTGNERRRIPYLYQ